MKKSTTTAIETKEILIKDILFSNNYRGALKPVTDESLAGLAESIKTNGVIQSIIVRPSKEKEGKYELVAGYRRLRGSVLAGKKTIPATIRELTDEQVKEIQLLENLQRENPHPMEEALAIYELLNFKETKNTVEIIAAKFGKTEAFVYQRNKLNNLIKEVQEIFLFDKLNISQALRIARLDQDCQNQFYNAYCLDWMEDHWIIRSFNDKIESLQLDLDDAPFNIKDSKLDKKAGSCTKCQHNTAVTFSLFPEDGQDARCTNSPCYTNKCRLSARILLAAAIKQNPELPIAFCDGDRIEIISKEDPLLQGKTILTEHDDFDYFRFFPTAPIRENFNSYSDEEDNQQEYNDELDEYNDEIENLERETALGNMMKAIYISLDDTGAIIYYKVPRQGSDNENNSHNGFSSGEFKAKDFQEAAKNKALTPEIIKCEKQRLIDRIERAIEIDKEKLQIAYYDALRTSDAVNDKSHPVGQNDKAAMIFVLYDSLNYNGRKEFLKTTFSETETEQDTEDLMMHFFYNATDTQISLLIRMSLLNKLEARFPNGLCGSVLRDLVAGTPGLSAESIIAERKKIADEREFKLSQKIAALDKQIEQTTE